MNICKVEDCSEKVYGHGYCSKHFTQIKRHGKIFKNTRKDLNIVVDKGYYCELILCNNKMEEVGRAKVDKEDLSKVQKYGRWTLDSYGYVCNFSYKKRNVKMHRVIMNAKKDEEVDHRKVGKKYKSDNRKKNLRLCTHQENNFNKLIRSSNTSGYKGVSWSKEKEKWASQIMMDGKKKHLGYFDSKIEASKAYSKAAKNLHKKFYNKR